MPAEYLEATRARSNFLVLASTCGTTLLLWFGTAVAAELAITVLDSATGAPIEDVFVATSDSTLTSATDGCGKIYFDVVPSQVTLTLSHIGYQTRTVKSHVDTLGSEIQVMLEPISIQLPEVVIHSWTDKTEQGKTEISTVELSRYPSPTEDPLRFLKVLPGITSGNDFSGSYNVQGGNYDQNLVYINGVEIDRPLQLRRGLAESFSMLNPAMIDSMTFRSISFAAEFGDKLSSMVEATYKIDSKKLEGDLELSGSTQNIVVRGPVGKRLSFNSGARYSNLERYTRGLQVRGEFVPIFWDWQTQARFRISPYNQFDVFAATFTSDFKMKPDKLRLSYNCSVLRHLRVCDEFTGSGKGAERFKYEGDLVAVSWTHLSPIGVVKAHVNYSRTSEREDTDLEYSVKPDSIRSTEKHDSRLRLAKIEGGLTGTGNLRSVGLKIGVGAKRSGLDGKVASVHRISYDRGVFLDESTSFDIDRGDIDTFFYFQSKWGTRRTSMNSGIRVVQFGTTDETLLLPRVSIALNANTGLTFTFSAGRHTQPPFYKEYVVDSVARPRLKSQKSDQFGVGVTYELKNSLNWTTEVFYRDQAELISYQIDDLRIVYSGRNDSDGFAYGINTRMRGQLDSLIGIACYSYLVAREDIKGDDRGNIPRPVDQRHTVSVYLEDRMYLEYLRLRNLLYSRFHIRMLYGSGFPHTPQVLATSQIGGRILVEGERNSRRDRPYFRFDIGMTQAIDIAGKTLHLRQEVANMFDQHNVVGYSYFPSFRGVPVEVRRSLGRRVYNFSVSIKF